MINDGFQSNEKFIALNEKIKDEKEFENTIIEKSGKKKKKMKRKIHKLFKLNKDEESTTKRELKTSKIKNKLELEKQNNEIFNKGKNILKINE